ncbi:hypothetical protein FHL15_003449 [Xylaria flabelliformis]|uniref:Fucose-specific lectin n=1 Tax=Xylaria flabelliformis TaxID=2512241 RepID=A0A553I5K8_9PEZI|nr:hypothetical protein FHL15_003449 [Xylaria flabelliformis]
MASTRQILYILTAAAAVDAAFGPAFSTGPVADNTFIRESTSTLTLPRLPGNNAGDLSLWVGMGTSNGDLIQSIADTWQTGDWSIFAYTLLSTGPNSQMPVQSEATPASAGDRITMHYKYDDATQNYTQTVSINDKVVATLSTSDEHAQGWGSAVECAEENCGTVPAHTWTDTKIIMDVADPNYINTLGKSQGVTGDMSTSDGGKTWTVSTINIPEFTF